MNAVVTAIGKGGASAANTTRDASEEIQSRYSSELVIALSGPVGSGIQHVRDVLLSSLKAHKYDVVHIRVSGYFADLAKNLEIRDPTAGATGEFQRISKLQDLGNTLRKELGADLGAQIALDLIANDRAERHKGTAIGEIKPGRVAYVIDQLKNPREVALLRDVYGSLFYLVGVLSSYERRKLNLVGSMSGPEAESLIDRDRAESDSSGQQLEKTLKLADFFLRNSSDNTHELSRPIERFIGLVHGKNGVTPTAHERGMYAAYSAALRSACLSRQVGAAIADKSGNIISTGCNDVPKAGGGLYDADGHDHRCVHREGGTCFNDKYKDKLRDEITKILHRGGVESFLASKLANEIRSETRLRDLIEFSRAVHAEMDALIAAARRGGTSVQDGTLYTTTYPCHNCARHIVAAGIMAVYFIEPYGKSLAGELHGDSINHDSDSQGALFAGSKVSFLHFDGVSPRRFSDLFYAQDSRKDSQGKAVRYAPEVALQKAPELLDNYREIEAKIAQRLRARLGSLPPRDGAA